MDLILLLDAPQHRQLDFIFRLPHPSVTILSIMDEAGRNPLFPIFRRTLDVQQFVKVLFW
jgi:hypothetical protein